VPHPTWAAGDGVVDPGSAAGVVVGAGIPHLTHFDPRAGGLHSAMWGTCVGSAAGGRPGLPASAPPTHTGGGAADTGAAAQPCARARAEREAQRLRGLHAVAAPNMPGPKPTFVKGAVAGVSRTSQPPHSGQGAEGGAGAGAAAVPVAVTVPRLQTDLTEAFDEFTAEVMLLSLSQVCQWPSLVCGYSKCWVLRCSHRTLEVLGYALGKKHGAWLLCACRRLVGLGVGRLNIGPSREHYASGLQLLLPGPMYVHVGSMLAKSLQCLSVLCFRLA
jgi:hypothetical protein